MTQPTNQPEQRGDDATARDVLFLLHNIADPSPAQIAAATAHAGPDPDGTAALPTGGALASRQDLRSIREQWIYWGGAGGDR